MECFRIRGGARLRGTVAASGSKNAALPILAASILAAEEVTLAGVPQVADVDTLSLLLGHLGVEVKRGSDRRLRIATVDPQPTRPPVDLVRRMRASFCVLGPLLARRGRAIVPLPGGCAIGPRPVDLHLAGLAALGADVRIERGHAVVSARRLRGATIDLVGPQGPTVTGTANVLSAAVLAQGTTILRHAAAEPEIVDLAGFLQRLGADIEGAGSDTIVVRGVRELGGACYTIIPDRIEAGTLLIAAAITGSTVCVTGLVPQHLQAVLAALQAAGQRWIAGSDWVQLAGAERPTATHLIAAPYPGLPSDLQAQFMALLSLAPGHSSITERVFPQRWRHVAQLNRLGSCITNQGCRSLLRGVGQLRGGDVVASDLRASAALVLAGLAAGGETIVQRVDHLDRGYEGLEAKLAGLGARIERARNSTASQAGKRAAASGLRSRTHSAASAVPL